MKSKLDLRISQTSRNQTFVTPGRFQAVPSPDTSLPCSGFMEPRSLVESWGGLSHCCEHDLDRAAGPYRNSRMMFSTPPPLMFCVFNTNTGGHITRLRHGPQVSGPPPTADNLRSYHDSRGRGFFLLFFKCILFLPLFCKTGAGNSLRAGSPDD
jgi:hypothetical protein